jgi:FRG domain-containing protein
MKPARDALLVGSLVIAVHVPARLTHVFRSTLTFLAAPTYSHPLNSAMIINVIDRTAIASPSDLVTWAEHLERLNQTTGPMLFRGQPGTYTNLMPGLGRELPSGAYDLAMKLEMQLIRNFRTHYAALKPTQSDLPTVDEMSSLTPVETLALMQHYEVPSRLLDWSESVWIATYFACASHPQADGALWFFDSSLLDVAAMDLTSAQVRDRVGSSIGTRPGDYHPAWGSPLLALVEPKTNARLRAQQGRLTASDNVTVDHAGLIWRLATRRHGRDQTGQSFGRHIIRASRKRDILRFLAAERGIDAKSLFPDIVGLSRYVRHEFEALRNEYY